MAANKNFLKLFSILAILGMMLSNVQPPRVQAQSGDGLKRQVNAQNGRVHFIGPETGRMLPGSKALGLGLGKRPKDPGMALAEKFGPEFGLKNPGRELAEVKKNQDKNRKVSVKYQQKHEGVPVMAGELIVNTDENGDLYSINGEISPDLSLSTQPSIDPIQAQQTALQAMAKWYQKNLEDFVSSEPKLWIYDESLLQPSTRPVELTWRMEVTPKDNSMPVRELVLVNAQRGNISLHYNQVDTEWHISRQTASVPLVEKTHSEIKLLNSSAQRSVQAAGVTWYVANTGKDTNDCRTTSTPCATINAAIGQAAISGDTIKVTSATYTGSSAEVVLIDKSVTLSGNWDGKP